MQRVGVENEGTRYLISRILKERRSACRMEKE